ncbi:hypothetical protein ACWM9A_10880 [Acetobacter pasteurianus]
MTDARIEAAARALCDAQGWCPDGGEITPRNFPTMDKNWKVYEAEAQIAVSAADAVTKAHIVPHNIPADRMRVAKNTLYRWKGGALSDEDAIGMIVCAVASAPLEGGGNG